MQARPHSETPDSRGRSDSEKSWRQGGGLVTVAGANTARGKKKGSWAGGGAGERKKGQHLLVTLGRGWTFQMVCLVPSAMRASRAVSHLPVSVWGSF